MKPTNERLYDPRIDQLRACAFLGVASLHFFTPLHTDLLYTTPGVNLLAPFIVNGYFGVSLFFLLSGYILAKLAIEQGGDIHYGQFLVNRVLRIYPLWVVCLLLVMQPGQLSGTTMITSLLLFVQDLPALPFNVAWSVQQEFYLYLAFPVLFANLKRSRHFFVVLAFCFAVRFIMSHNAAVPTLRDMSYGTILGSVTLFVTGMFLDRLPKITISRAVRATLLVASVVALWVIASTITYSGGFFMQEQRPSNHLIWLFYPEVMAAAFSALLISYDLAADPANPGRFGNIFATIGKISYSGYLLHVLVIDFTRRWLSFFGLDETSAFLQFAIFLALLLPVSWASFNIIERPFLRFRRRYVTEHSQRDDESRNAA